MRSKAFARFILNEEITSNGQPLGVYPKKKRNQQPQDDPDAVPEFGAEEDPAAQQADPNDPTAQQQDPNAPQGIDPNDPATAQQGDPNDPNAQQQDPNAMDPNALQGMDPNAAQGGGDPAQQGDPNAMDPNAQGDPNDPNAQQDPNAMMDPNAQQGMDPNDPSFKDNEIQELEAKLFQDLKPEQILIAKRTLKGQFMDLYEVIDDNIERLNKVDRSANDISSINFVIKKLNEIRMMLKRALVNNFDAKTYAENQIELQKFQAVFNALSNIIEEVGKRKKMLNRSKYNGKGRFRPKSKRELNNEEEDEYDNTEEVNDDEVNRRVRRVPRKASQNMDLRI